MKRKIYRLWFFLGVSFFSFLFSCEKKTFLAIFSEAGKIPGKVIFDATFFKEKGTVFFVLQDYENSDNKIVEYDVKKGIFFKPLIEVDPAQGKVDEVVIDSSRLVFTLLERAGEEAKHRIFSYSLDSNEVPQLLLELTRSYEDLFPLQLCLAKSGICWLEQNVSESKTIIWYYSFASKEKKSLFVYPFTEEGYGNSCFFLEAKGNLLYFDHKNEKQIQIGVYDLVQEEIQSWYRLPSEYEINFKARINSEEKFLAIYGKAKEGDLVYLLDLTVGYPQKLATIMDNSRIYNDRLAVLGRELWYPVQRQSHRIDPDLFYLESYALDSRKVRRFNRCFDVATSGNYRAILMFGKIEEGIQSVAFELAKIK